jgi:hypothetical protein
MPILVKRHELSGDKGEGDASIPPFHRQGRHTRAPERRIEGVIIEIIILARRFIAFDSNFVRKCVCVSVWLELPSSCARRMHTLLNNLWNYLRNRQQLATAARSLTFHLLDGVTMSKCEALLKLARACNSGVDKNKLEKLASLRKKAFCSRLIAPVLASLLPARHSCTCLN